MTTKAHNARVNADRGDMNLVKLIERYADEDKARAYLEGLRWPNGVTCPRCQGEKVARVKARGQFDCSSCGHQFSVTSGTVLHDTHLPLWKWFLATYLMCEARKGVSANQLKRTLGVAYKTAWYLCHRIRSAMTQEGTAPLSGVVEADETYVGGKARGQATKREAARNRLKNKTVVLGAIERGGNLRMRVAPNARKHHVQGFLRDVVAPDAEAVYTDSLRSYHGIGDADTRHESVNHSAEEWVRGDVHTNGIESAWSLFDRAVIGSYHKLSTKHLPLYLDEFAFRFNNRENPHLFRDTLVRLLSAEALPYAALVAGPSQALPRLAKS